MNAPCPVCGTVGDCPNPHACAETISVERGPSLADLLDERDACAECVPARVVTPREAARLGGDE